MQFVLTSKSSESTDENVPSIRNHVVPPALLVHIGDIIVSFVMLESHIQNFIGSLIHAQRVGQVITAELSFKNLRALAISLYKETYGEDQDYRELCGLLKRAARVEETRNQIAHSEWGAAPDNPNIITRIKMTAKVKTGLHFNFEKVQESDLSTFATDIKVITHDFMMFYIRLTKAGKVS